MRPYKARAGNRRYKSLISTIRCPQSLDFNTVHQPQSGKSLVPLGPDVDATLTEQKGDATVNLSQTNRSLNIPNRNKKQDRVKLSLLCLSGYAILLSLRFNLSVAIISMTKKPKTEIIRYECAINESIKQG